MNIQDRGKRSKQTFKEIPSLKSEQSKTDASRLRDTWRAVPNRGGASGLLGKDEVPSSNLGSSSKKPVFPFGNAGFFLFVPGFAIRTGDLFARRASPVRLWVAAPNRKASPKGLAFLFGIVIT